MKIYFLHISVFLQHLFFLNENNIQQGAKTLKQHDNWTLANP